MASSATATEVLVKAAQGKKLDLWKGAKTFARREPVGFVCVFVVIAFIVVATFAPWIQPYGESDIVGKRLQAPSSEHFFGTDNIGRDVFSRVLMGARVSMLVGFVSVAMGLVSGAALGITSAYFGGKFDLYIQRLVDAKLAMPTLILAMLLLAVLGPGLWSAVIAIGILGIGNGSRVIRSSVLSIKEEMYVEAARAIGATAPRVMARHILPQVVPLLIILASVSIPGAISIEASLSFLGIGVQPPTPSWGNMLSGPGRAYMETAPWLVLGPGIALSVVVLAYNLLGDSLRDVLDPRLRGSRK
jgi:peptide/nickel transport system permease protein